MKLYLELFECLHILGCCQLFQIWLTWGWLVQQMMKIKNNKHWWNNWYVNCIIAIMEYIPSPSTGKWEINLKISLWENWSKNQSSFQMLIFKATYMQQYHAPPHILLSWPSSKLIQIYLYVQIFGSLFIHMISYYSYYILVNLSLLLLGLCDQLFQVFVFQDLLVYHWNLIN